MLPVWAEAVTGCQEVQTVAFDGGLIHITAVQRTAVCAAFSCARTRAKASFGPSSS
jgi:hypothetical protein